MSFVTDNTFYQPAGTEMSYFFWTKTRTPIDLLEERERAIEQQMISLVWFVVYPCPSGNILYVVVDQQSIDLSAVRFDDPNDVFSSSSSSSFFRHPDFQEKISRSDAWPEIK